MSSFRLVPMVHTSKHAIVSDVDFPLVRSHKWYLHKTGYAITKVGSRLIYMHRLVLGIEDEPRSVQGDHVHGNRLDNRRSELRVATNSQNSANRKQPVGASGYRGVYRLKSPWKLTRPFFAQISVKGKMRYLGYFSDPVVAAQVYDAEAKKVFGPFAQLNFP